MDKVVIMVDIHPSGKGFQVSAITDEGAESFPNPIPDIEDALKHAFYMRNAIEREFGITIPDLDIRVSQDSLERNAFLTSKNMSAYRNIMAGEVKVIHDPQRN